jgi:hypothetical protein
MGMPKRAHAEGVELECRSCAQVQQGGTVREHSSVRRAQPHRRSIHGTAKKLAESIGFGSFAKPVHELQLDRQFTMWLLPKVCSMARSIIASGGKRIMIFEEDIAKVFGVPCSGKDPWETSLDKSQKLQDKISGLIGMDEENTSPMATAFKTLKDLTGNKLTAK